MLTASKSDTVVPKVHLLIHDHAERIITAESERFARFQHVPFA